MKFLFAFLFPLSLFAQTASLSIIKTGQATSVEGLIFSGGEYTKKVIVNHSAFLIKNGDKTILFDTGLGSQIDQQFKADMPWWGKIFFDYELLQTAKEQLDKANIKVDQIFLSHVHWDHASGLVDFPDTPVAIPDQELKERDALAVAAVLPSQLKIEESRWKSFQLEDKPYLGFEQSYDVFGDESVMIVPLPGHTFGSVGMFIKTNTHHFFLLGDLVWDTKAITGLHEKMFVASKVVDRNPPQVFEQIKKVHEFMQKNPNVLIVPAHEEKVQKTLGYFPRWL